MENRSAAAAVLGAVEESLRRGPFSYQGSRTLSGQEEGAFGWVTLNYLDQRLTQVRPRRRRRLWGPPTLTGLSAAGPGNHGRPGPGRSLHPDQFCL